jgi:indole-3-pyruvate monooxygenase
VSAPVVIIGAGPAGLAVGACLRRQNIDFEILERSDRIASTWRRHYDRLHLHTARGTSALPFRPFPDHFPRYVSRDQLIEYLESYAEAFGLRPRLSCEVERVTASEKGWQIDSFCGEFTAWHVVFATGINRQPNRPSWPGLADFPGEVLHSSEYRNGRTFAGMRVLVVGIGNSGGEIAIDLHEHGAHPTISIRDGVNVIPRSILGIPVERIAIATSWIPPKVVDKLNAPIRKLVVGDLSGYGLPSPSSGPTSQITDRGRIPLIDVGTIDLIKRGKIEVRPGIERFDGREAYFVDGRTDAFDAVVLATGYRHGLEHILDEPIGHVEVRRQINLPERPGLHFCGFRIASGGMLREIGIEARRVARAIFRDLG